MAFPHPSATSRFPLFIGLLGGYCLLHWGDPIETRGEKVQALLSHLVMENDYRLERKTLVQRLWPDVPVELANGSLHTLVYNIRNTHWGFLNGQPIVRHDKTSYFLNPNVGIAFDVRCFYDAAR